MAMNSGFQESATREQQPTQASEDGRRLAARVAEKIDPKAIVDGAKRLPDIIRREAAEHPYRALGVAMGVGFGVGAVLSSRIARVALLTASGYVLNEVARTRLKHFLDDIEG